MILPAHRVEKPWGVDRLPAPFGGGEGARIGEIWFDDPETPSPLLVKFLFTAERRSVQVQPDDAAARARGHPHGESESWLVIWAEPGATLGIGSITPMDGAALRQAAIDGSIVELMRWIPVAAGDYVHIPAGTVHAIGAGVHLVEVQQNIDLTYRLYDYGRPRALHLDDGVAVADARPHKPAWFAHVAPGESRALPTDGHFRLWHVAGQDGLSIIDGDGPLTLIPLSDGVAIAGEPLPMGACARGMDMQTIAFMPDARALIACEH